MNTTVRGLRKSRIAILAAMLAIIAGICTLFCTGAQQSAWAEESGKTIFTSGSISSLPFNKTTDGFTVDIFAEEDKADTVEIDANDSADETDADEEDASSKESSGSSSNSSAKSAASTVTIEITADEDTDAVKVVISADGKEITKDIPGEMLEADDTVTFTLDNCTKVSKLTIYGPEEKKEADNSSASDSSKDASDSSVATDDPKDASDSNSGNADDTESDITFTSEDDATDANDEGTDGKASDSGITITPVDKEDEDADVDPETLPLTVTLNDENEPSGGYVVYVESGEPFGTGKLDIEGTETVSIKDFNPEKEGYTFTGKWTIKETGEELADSTIITSDITADPVFEPVEQDTGNGNSSNTNTSNSSSNDEGKKVTVTFVLNGHGSIAVNNIPVDKGSCVPAFDNPTEKGWIFERWITEDEQTFVPGQTPVNKNMTVYAIWSQDIPAGAKSIDASKDDKDKDESKTFSIVVSKVSAEDGTCLKGAEFVLKDKSGNVIGSWTSGESGMVIDGLRKDTTYVLNETKAPDGYGIEKPININFVEENGKASVKIDQGGSAVVPLATNNDGIAALNVKDAPGKSKSASTTMPLTGDNQNLPLAGLCFGGAAAVAAAVAFMAYRKRKLA